MLLLADIRRAQYRQALGISGHDPVFDTVVHHLDEMAAAVRAAVQIALLGGAIQLFATRSAGNIADSRSEGRENRIEMLDDILLAADHHAVATFQTPYASAGAHVHIVNLFGCEVLCALDVVNVVGVSAIDEGVAWFEVRQQVGDGLIDRRCGHHEPHRTRLCYFFNEIDKRVSSDCILLDEFTHSLWRSIEHHATVSFSNQPPHHVGAHPAQPYHSKLHKLSSFEKCV